MFVTTDLFTDTVTTERDLLAVSYLFKVPSMHIAEHKAHYTTKNSKREGNIENEQGTERQ